MFTYSALCPFHFSFCKFFLDLQVAETLNENSMYVYTYLASKADCDSGIV